MVENEKWHNEKVAKEYIITYFTFWEYRYLKGSDYKLWLEVFILIGFENIVVVGVVLLYLPTTTYKQQRIGRKMTLS